MEEAIHAGNDSVFASYTKFQDHPEVKHTKTEGEKIARLADSDSFHALQNFIDKRIDELKSLSSPSLRIGPNDTVEAVGFRYLAADVAINYLKEIRDYPNQKKKSLAKNDK